MMTYVKQNWRNNSTTDHLIQHDKKELVELLKEFRQQAQFIDTVLELEELIVVYLLDKFIDSESLLTKFYQ